MARFARPSTLAARTRRMGGVRYPPRLVGRMRGLSVTLRPPCEDPRPHAWSMCAAFLCPCIFQSPAAPLERSHYQTSEFLNTSEFPTEFGAVARPFTLVARTKRIGGGSAAPGWEDATAVGHATPPLRCRANHARPIVGVFEKSISGRFVNFWR